MRRSGRSLTIPEAVVIGSWSHAGGCGRRVVSGGDADGARAAGYGPPGLPMDLRALRGHHASITARSDSAPRFL